MGIKIHPNDKAEIIRELASEFASSDTPYHISDVYAWMIEQADKIDAEYEAKRYKPTPEEKAKHKAAEIRAMEMGYPA